MNEARHAAGLVAFTQGFGDGTLEGLIQNERGDVDQPWNVLCEGMQDVSKLFYTLFPKRTAMNMPSSCQFAS